MHPTVTRALVTAIAQPAQRPDHPTTLMASHRGGTLYRALQHAHHELCPHMLGVLTRL